MLLHLLDAHHHARPHALRAPGARVAQRAHVARARHAHGVRVVRARVAHALRVLARRVAHCLDASAACRAHALRARPQPTDARLDADAQTRAHVLQHVARVRRARRAARLRRQRRVLQRRLISELRDRWIRGEQVTGEHEVVGNRVTGDHVVGGNQVSGERGVGGNRVGDRGVGDRGVGDRRVGDRGDGDRGVGVHGVEYHGIVEHRIGDLHVRDRHVCADDVVADDGGVVDNAETVTRLDDDAQHLDVRARLGAHAIHAHVQQADADGEREQAAGGGGTQHRRRCQVVRDARDDVDAHRRVGLARDAVRDARVPPAEVVTQLEHAQAAIGQRLDPRLVVRRLADERPADGWRRPEDIERHPAGVRRVEERAVRGEPVDGGAGVAGRVAVDDGALHVVYDTDVEFEVRRGGDAPQPLRPHRLQRHPGELRRSAAHDPAHVDPAAPHQRAHPLHPAVAVPRVAGEAEPLEGVRRLHEFLPQLPERVPLQVDKGEQHEASERRRRDRRQPVVLQVEGAQRGEATQQGRVNDLQLVVREVEVTERRQGARLAERAARQRAQRVVAEVEPRQVKRRRERRRDERAQAAVTDADAAGARREAGQQRRQDLFVGHRAAQTQVLNMHRRRQRARVVNGDTRPLHQQQVDGRGQRRQDRRQRSAGQRTVDNARSALTDALERTWPRQDRDAGLDETDG